MVGLRLKSTRTDTLIPYTALVLANLGTPVVPGSLFDAVLDAFGSDADILAVCKEGRPVASVLNLYHRGAVLPYWGGGTQEARGLRANDMMYFALMSHARSRGCTRFDFGRSKVGTGAAAFKKRSEEHTSELQSLMRISYAVFCLKKKKQKK